MTNLDSIFKSRDITLTTKVHLVKGMVFPVVMYGCESWTVKKAERQRLDAFELWCWRRLLRVPWTARRSNQSILKEISPGISLEVMLKLKLQYFGHLIRRVDSLEKTLMLGGIGGRRRRGWQRLGWLDGITDWMDVSLSELRELVMEREARRAAIHGAANSRTGLSDWTELNWAFPSPGDLPNAGIEPRSPALQEDSLPAEPQEKPKGKQSWIFIGRTDAKAEAPILWPHDAKNWLIRKDSDAGKLWRQERKGWQRMRGWMVSLTRWTWVWASFRSR